MGEALKELASSGAIGATLVVVLAMLFWMVKVLIASFVRQTEAVIKAMNELVEASRAIRDNCQACRQDSVGSLREAQTAIEKKVEHEAWRVHDQTLGETKELLSAAVTKLDSTITGAIGRLSTEEKERRLQEQLDESRAHSMTPAPSGVVQR